MSYEYTLLDNGTDSLKKAKESIDEYEKLSPEHSFHYIKDAVIYLNHGIEILLKYMLSRENETFIFTNIDSYINAKKELDKLRAESPYIKATGFGFTHEKYNILDTKTGKSLKTLSLRDSLKRVEYYCKIEVKDELKELVHYLNDYRDKLTHYTITFRGNEKDKLVKTLKITHELAIEFFEAHIDRVTEKIDSQRFDITKEELAEQQEAMEEYYRERAMSRLSIDYDEE